MSNTLYFKTIFAIALFFVVLPDLLVFGQSLSDFELETKTDNCAIIKNNINFNGYTNYWHNSYTQWSRYANLFKMATPEIQSTVLQSKVDVAEDMGLAGLLLQEGFVSYLYSDSYSIIENPTLSELENTLQKGNTLVIIDPSTELGRQLEEKANPAFEWTENIQSYQHNAVDLEIIKAFYFVHNSTYLFVLLSSSQEQINKLLSLIDGTRDILEKYRLHKGLFGVSSLLKSVTIEPGHPLEIMGIGMNEGNTWFVFDGYMDFLAKKEIEEWVNEVNLPIVAEVGFAPIYGCSDYDGLQIQDMETKQAWIDYARKKGGYVFRPVYSPESDEYKYDGYFVNKGNKEQIDNENVPFISTTGHLSRNLTTSMILFIEKEKPLSSETMWEAIMSRKEVAILDQAQLMGPATFRHAIALLYLDKFFLDDYFYDQLDLKAEVEGYNLIVTAKNYTAKTITGDLEANTSSAIKVTELPTQITLKSNEEKRFTIPLQPNKNAMGKTNPIAINFFSGEKEKKTLTMLDLPPVISVHQLLYAHAHEVIYPVTVHNFGSETNFPVEVSVFKKNDLRKPVFTQTKTYNVTTSSFQEQEFRLTVTPGDYLVRTKALDVITESQLGVGKNEGKSYVYEIDLDSDGVNEYRMENDSVSVTLLRTGARVIEYIVKSKNDNIFFKGWPEKTKDHRRPYRDRGYYPYGGFEDFIGQASMETHRIYDARITREKGDYVQVEMEADYYGNHLKKIFTLYGNSPLLEVRFVLTFKDPEVNVIGPQPILELGKSHGMEDVFIVPSVEGLKEYRMKSEDYYGQAIDIAEGWNAGYDTKEDIAFIGAFPVAQPIFLHMWMNHPRNTDAPHYYVEFQPWTPIIQKTKMYFSYYIWGASGDWKKSLEELKKRNLISTK